MNGYDEAIFHLDQLEPSPSAAAWDSPIPRKELNSPFDVKFAPAPPPSPVFLRRKTGSFSIADQLTDSLNNLNSDSVRKRADTTGCIPTDHEMSMRVKRTSLPPNSFFGSFSGGGYEVEESMDCDDEIDLPSTLNFCPSNLPLNMTGSCEVSPTASDYSPFGWNEHTFAGDKMKRNSQKRRTNDSSIPYPLPRDCNDMFKRNRSARSSPPSFLQQSHISQSAPR